MAPQKRVDARDENRQLEGFRQVVVRARLESAENILGAPARREH